MNQHQCAHAIVFNALSTALAQAYGDVPTHERHRLAELVCTEAEIAVATQKLTQAHPPAGGSS